MESNITVEAENTKRLYRRENPVRKGGKFEEREKERPCLTWPSEEAYVKRAEGSSRKQGGDCHIELVGQEFQIWNN